MRFVVITGPSGAGKTLALHSFEDAGFDALDNLPPRLLPAWIAHCRQNGQERGAVVIDPRSGPAFADLPAVLQELRRADTPVETLFLDASDDTLIQRYKETRRPHPHIGLPVEGVNDRSVLDAIQAEREQLNPMRALADRILDTSALSALQFRNALHTDYAPDTQPEMQALITSFGFKHGLPLDADLVFDVRFLANPHYVPELKRRNGLDGPVRAYVHADPMTQPFQAKMHDLITFAMPQYQREGKAYLNIAIGCTGGKHRSVVLSEDLAALLRAQGYRVGIRHRDVALDQAPVAPESFADAAERESVPPNANRTESVLPDGTPAQSALPDANRAETDGVR